MQAAPELPQACDVSPLEHAPEASQHPVHVAGLHAGVGDEHPVTAATATNPTTIDQRM